MRAIRVLLSLVDRWGERRVAGAIMLLGAAMRVAAVALQPHRLAPLRHEADNVAAALATRGEFADAFGPGTGLTAHVGWAVPMIPAGVYRLLGAHTPAAELALALLAIAATSVAFYLVFRSFRLLGVPAIPCLAALAFVALVPIQLDLETADLRVWESGYAALGLAIVLRSSIALDARPFTPLPALLGLAVFTAFLEVLSPSAGLGAAAILGLLILRRARWARGTATIAATLAAFLVLTLPWQQRNREVVGPDAGSRSSLGLSLKIGYNDRVLTALTPQQAYKRGIEEYGPHREDGTGLARLRAAGGEAAYARLLRGEALAWMRAHPAETARIQLRNLRDYYLPPAWFWVRFIDDGSRNPAIRVRSWVLSALSVVALATLLVAVLRRRWRWLYVAAAVLPPALPYVLAYPLLRYRYPVSTILIFAAFAGVAALARYGARRFLPVPAGQDPAGAGSVR